MSFDFFFYYGDAKEAAQAAQQDTDEERAATPQEEAHMRRVVDALLAKSPNAELVVPDEGFANGVWVGNGDWPDCDIYARHVYCSFHPDVSAPDADRTMRSFIAFFEGHGYRGFDPQRGEVVSSQTFSFFDAPPPKPVQSKPWWRFW